MVCFCCAIPAAYAGFLLYIAQRTANRIESGNVEVIYGKTQKIIQENRHFLAKGTLSDGTSVRFWVPFELIKSKSGEEWDFMAVYSGKSGYAIIRTDAGDIRLADRISHFSACAEDDQ